MASSRNKDNKANQIAIVTANEHGGIIQVNRVACEMFGYDASGLVGQNVRILMPSPFREQHQSFIERYIQTGESNIMSATRRIEGITREGKLLHLNLALGEVGDSSTGRIFLASFTYVPEQPANVRINSEGVILFANEALHSMFGYEPGELDNSPITVLMPEAYASRHQGHINTYLKTSRKRVIGRTRNVTAKHRNGTLFPIALQVAECAREEGKLAEFFGTITAVDVIDAVLTIGADGMIMSASRNAPILLGYSEAELISGMLISTLVPHFDAPSRGQLSPSLSGVFNTGGVMPAGSAFATGGTTAPSTGGGGCLRPRSGSSPSNAASKGVTNMESALLAGGGGGGGGGCPVMGGKSSSSSTSRSSGGGSGGGGCLFVQSTAALALDHEEEDVITAVVRSSSTSTSSQPAPPTVQSVNASMGGCTMRDVVDATAVATDKTVEAAIAVLQKQQHEKAEKRSREEDPMDMSDNSNSRQHREDNSSTHSESCNSGRSLGSNGSASRRRAVAVNLSVGSGPDSAYSPMHSARTSDSGLQEGGYDVMVRHKDGTRFKAFVSLKRFFDRRMEMFSCQIARDHSDYSDILCVEGGTEVVVGKYRVSEAVAKGGFAEVFTAEDANGQQVAIKCLEKATIPRFAFAFDDALGRYMPTEIVVLRVLKHDSIIRLIDVVETDHCFYLVMEFAKGGDLFSRVQKHGRLSEDHARHILKQLVSALLHCASLDIWHRDVKHENIVFVAPEDGPPSQAWKIKLVDFGLAAFVNAGDTFSDFAGTAVFAAPEVLLGKSYGAEHVEVWSIGVLLYGMVVGALPFQSLDRAVSGMYDLPGDISDLCKDLLSQLLAVDPSARPSLAQVPLHPWMLGDNDSTMTGYGSSNNSVDMQIDTPRSLKGSGMSRNRSRDILDSAFEKQNQPPFQATSVSVTSSTVASAAPTNTAATAWRTNPESTESTADSENTPAGFTGRNLSATSVVPRLSIHNCLRAAKEKGELPEAVSDLLNRIDLTLPRREEAFLRLAEAAMEFLTPELADDFLSGRPIKSGYNTPSSRSNVWSLASSPQHSGSSLSGGPERIETMRLGRDSTS